MADHETGVHLLASHVPLAPMRALANVDMTVTAGCHAVIGANGAGKSTLLRALAAVRLDGVDSLIWDGRNAQTMSISERISVRAAILADDRPVFALSCAEFVSIAVRQSRHHHRQNIALQHLDSLGIASLAGQDVRTLSAGEWAWARLAQASASEPSVLILDELDAAVDASARVRLYASARLIAATVIAVSHDVGSVSQWADSVWEIIDETVVHK
ncbi:MAG: ABC transporter ATP-binding protein [Actinomycetes bacterium]